MFGQGRPRKLHIDSRERTLCEGTTHITEDSAIPGSLRLPFSPWLFCSSSGSSLVSYSPAIHFCRPARTVLIASDAPPPPQLSPTRASAPRSRALKLSG